ADRHEGPPDRGEPRQLQELRLDDAEHPFSDDHAERIGADHDEGAGDDMASAADKDRRQFKRLDDRQRHREHEQRRIRRKPCDGLAGAIRKYVYWHGPKLAFYAAVNVPPVKTFPARFTAASG